MIASGSLVSRMKPLVICLWARQGAIGKQPPPVQAQWRARFGEKIALSIENTAMFIIPIGIRHHCAPPDHGGLGAISQPPLAGEP